MTRLPGNILWVSYGYGMVILWYKYEISTKLIVYWQYDGQAQDGRKNVGQSIKMTQLW
ncbi:MAG: hypothetical protein IJ204_07505 [Paludibacteraceae bacterium]|nr:hypothetical protein [Paludibacteraceae bacterium]